MTKENNELKDKEKKLLRDYEMLQMDNLNMEREVN